MAASGLLAKLGQRTDEGLSAVGQLWDELFGEINSKTAALRAQGEALRPQTGSFGEGTGVARDYLSPQLQSELDRLVADKFRAMSMRSQGYSPEYTSGLLKFGEEGMTQEARMARAAEQQFEGPFYRWTENGLGRVVRTPEVDTGLKFGPAGYGSPQTGYGARYVDPTKANVQPLMARGPLADLNEVDRVSQELIAQRKEAGLPQWPGHQQHWAEMQEALKAEGYRGVRYGDKEVASFEPEKNMRSINAVFDPEGKGGLLGGLGGATVLGGGLTAVDAMNNEAEAAGISNVGNFIRRMAEKEIDPRFGNPLKGSKPRKAEQGLMESVTANIESRGTQSVPEVSIFDLEGKPFVTSMSDRTAAGGVLRGVNDVELPYPVNLQGGQGYMFENPGQTWASGEQPVSNIMKVASQVKKQAGGVDPIYLPWRMAPTSSDFATMSGETMIAYASANMSKKTKNALNRKIKNIIPGWKGVDDPASIEQFRGASKDQRIGLKNIMDTEFRDEGSLTIGQARIAVTDPAQLAAKEGGLMNVGEIRPDLPVIQGSGHPSYPMGVPGEGKGRLKEDLMVHELLPSVVAERRIADPRAPMQSDLRAMQMGAKGGVITEGLLRRLQDTGVKAVAPVAVPATLLGGSEEAEAGVGSKILGQVSEMGFFSPLERAVGGLSQQKGTGDQMLAMIQKQAGVKPEEVQWTGLGDFLAGKPSVTKSEIEDYLLNNRVELKEISLESVNPYPYKTGDEWQAAVSAAQRRGDWDEAERLHEAWAAEQGHGPAGSPKFERYTTPGGSNYRELLMTMPPTKKSIPQWKVVRPDGYVDSTYVSEESARIQASRRGEGYTIREAEPAQVEGGFRSSHYDQPNILAHTRVKDYEQDGQKILHVDEVQSDWHQAGRKQGYVGDVKQHVAYYDTPKGPVEIGFGKTAEEAIANADPGWKNLVEIKTRAEKIQKGDPLSVPDAPFKKNWHELMTRRILQEAADKGYSRVTFTTGRTQADRYDLSKQVDSISVPEIMQNSRAVKIQDVNGNSFNLKVSNDGTVSGNLPSAEQFRGRKLDEVIGKEMADKIMGLDKPQTFSGVDLKVGGEGMKGFYDNMMVKAFNKEGKKFGVKVEPYKLRAGREVSWEEWMAQEHPNVRPMDIIGTPREAQLDAEYEAFLKNGGGEQVWSMEIPPEMRAKKKAEGSPMFAAAPFGLLGAGAMTPDKDAQAAMIAENIRQTPLSAFDLNRKPQAEMRAPRYGLLADIADAFEAGSRNDLLGSGESAARVANALAYGQRPGVLDTIVGSFEAVDPITWASLFGAMSKGR